MTRIARLLTVLVGLFSTFPEAAMADGISPLILKAAPLCGKFHDEELMKKVLCTGGLKDDNVCTIKDHPGGCDRDFTKIWQYIFTHHTKVRFEGWIRSATAVLAANLTPYPGTACVGPHVKFGFHQSWNPGPMSTFPGDEFGTYTPNNYPPRIKVWIDAQPGGEPANLKKFLIMSADVALNFWQKCPELEPNFASK